MNHTLLIIFAYLAIVFLIGPLSRIVARSSSREDFFLAARTIGPFLLLMSLFGTHMSAFALIGSTGEGYKNGVGVFALMASSSALVAPLVFFFVGTRVWQLGKRHGYVTQAEYLRDRFDCGWIGTWMFFMLVLLVIPYLLIGVIGGGVILHGVAGMDNWLGSLIVVMVTIGYVSIGGLRGTAWANAFQTMVFMIIGVISFVTIVNHMGGSDSLLANLQRLAQQVADDPELRRRLSRGAPFSTEGIAFQLKYLSYMLIPLSVGTFPHVNMHWLTAKSVKTFKTAVVFYPLCILAVWLPMVLLGTLSSAQLTTDNANAVLVMLIKQVGDPVLTGLLAAGVLAAVMSSLDSQSLCLSEMFTNDVLVHYGGEDRFSEGQQVFLSRIFVLAVLGITWLVSLTNPGFIFVLGTWCFAGFTALLPVMLAALFWRRASKWGVAAGILAVVGLGVYMLWCAVDPEQLVVRPDYRPFGLPVHPVAPLTFASSVAVVLVSMASPAPPPDRLRRFFAD